MKTIKSEHFPIILLLNWNRITFLILALLLCLPGLLFAQSLTAKVSSYMTAQARVNHFSGSILIAQGGRVLVRRCYGPASGDTIAKCTADKQYPIGSIAKQFTAAAILQYGDRQKINLADSACKYIDDCPPAWQGITILDLLTQTDGLPEIETSSDKPELSRNLRVAGGLTSIRNKPLEFTPRTRVKFGYSGYAVLSAIVENLSGEPYRRYLHHNVFVPAGMHNTVMDVDRKWKEPSQWITPVDLAEARPYAFAHVYSTVDDLYGWIRSLDTDTIMSKSSVEEMLTPRVDGFGLGWAILKEFGREADTQNGGFNLLSSSVRRFPQSRTCVIVLSDATNIDADQISHDLAAILFDKHYEIPAARRPISIDPVVYNSYEGVYETSLGLSLVVKREQDQLLVQAGRQQSVELTPMSDTKFYIPGRDAEMNFVMGTNGKAAELILQQGDREISFRRRSN